MSTVQETITRTGSQAAETIVLRLQHVWNSQRIEDVTIGILLILFGVFAGRFLSAAFLRTVGERFTAHQKQIWGRGIFYLWMTLFTIAGLREMGFNLSVFLGAAGLLTVAFGFASQTSASNLISGLFLIGEGAFAVGDMIQVMFIRGQLIEGEVLSIDLMSVKLRTLDNLYIRIPNEQLIKTPVYNITRFPIRRIPIIVHVDYQEDLKRVRQVLLKLADEYPLVLNEPKPIVTVLSLKDSSIELLYGVWCRTEYYLKVRDEIQEIVRNGFVESGIQIPYPKIRISQDEHIGLPDLSEKDD